MSERSTRVAVDRTNSCINHDATCLVTIAAGPFVNVDTEVLE